MSDFKHNQINSTYFDLLTEQGIPEKFVKDYYTKVGHVFVELVSGKLYSRKLKTPAYVQTPGDVSERMVQSTAGSFAQ